VQIGRATGLCRAFATTTTGVGGEPLSPPLTCVVAQRHRSVRTAKQRQHWCTGNENDLVFDTFKEQQQRYQALLDGSKVWWWHGA
jgi:hypothetical protein